ncbi:MAG: ABC transporter substrate-binding protein [Desulfocucumaceae bacterium]
MLIGKCKRYFGLTLVCLLFLVPVALTGCGSGKSEPVKSAEAKVVNIGWSGPLSGGAAQYGKDTIEGLQMAVDEINGAGGITVNGQKYTFKIVSLDDQYKPDMTATNARRLRSENKTPMIFVPHAGGIYAMQEFNLDDKFLIVAHSSDPNIALRGNKLTFISAPSYTGQPDPFAKMAMEKYGKKLALLPGTTQYLKDWEASMIAAWQKQGGTVAGAFSMDYNKETDYFPYISKALATKPDVLFAGGPSKPTALLIKQTRQQGFKGGIIIPDQPRLEEMEQVVPLSDLEGTIGLMPLGKNPGPGVPKFVDAFKAKYSGKVPTFHNAGPYMAMKIVAQGMVKAGTVEDPVKIFEGMKQVFPMKDVPYQLDGIDEKGKLLMEDSGVMISDGKYGKAIPISAK